VFVPRDQAEKVARQQEIHNLPPTVRGDRALSRDAADETIPVLSGIVRSVDLLSPAVTLGRRQGIHCLERVGRPVGYALISVTRIGNLSVACIPLHGSLPLSQSCMMAGHRPGQLALAAAEEHRARQPQAKFGNST
jgi:hypothetical protein